MLNLRMKSYKGIMMIFILFFYNKYRMTLDATVHY